MAADTPFGRGDHEHGPPARVEPYLPASHAPVASFESTPTRFQSVAPPRRDALGVASGIVGLALKLTMLAILLALFVGLLGLIGVGGRSTAIVGEQVGAAFQRGVDSIGAAAHRVRDTFDPAHPPATRSRRTPRSTSCSASASARIWPARPPAQSPWRAFNAARALAARIRRSTLR